MSGGAAHSIAYGIGTVAIEFGCFALSYTVAVRFAALFPERFEVLAGLVGFIALVALTSWLAVLLLF